VYSWGTNAYGQLGFGDQLDYFIPAKIPWDIQKNKIIKLAAGSFHSLALTSNHTLYAWGSNKHGQLGIDNLGKKISFIPFLISVPGLEIDEVIVDVSTGLEHAALLTNKGNVYTWGCNFNGEIGHGLLIKQQALPKKLEQLKSITHIACGASHTIAVDKEGRIFSCGLGTEYQLGNGKVVVAQEPIFIENDGGMTKERSVLMIAPGAYHTLVLVAVQ